VIAGTLKPSPAVMRRRRWMGDGEEEEMKKSSKRAKEKDEGTREEEGRFVACEAEA
jgi:hypothetical protein